MTSRLVPFVSLALLMLATPALAQHSVRARACSAMHQGPAFNYYCFTNLNGTLSEDLGPNPSGTGSGSPTGPGQTAVSAQATLAGASIFGSGQVTSFSAVDLATATVRLRATPQANYIGVTGSPEAEWTETLTFVNATTGSASVPFSWESDGVLTPGLHRSVNLTSTLHLTSVAGAPRPTLPAIGGTGFLQINQAGCFPSNGAFCGEFGIPETHVYWRADSGSYSAASTPAPWVFERYGSRGSRLRGAFILPPGISKITLRGLVTLGCPESNTCDWSGPGHGVSFAFGAIPSGVSIASSSGVFLGTPVPQPRPTNLSVVSVVGNRATFRWTPPTSVVPTGYVLEGGVAPGQVLGSLPTGSTATTFSVDLPTGAFFVRMHALSASGRSAATNEVQVFVNVPQPPAAPARLLGLVNGSALGLSWMNPGSAGIPTSMLLDVSGAITATLPIPAGESFAFPAVPPGTYTFAVRAANAMGASAASAPVTLTFPGGCSGAPQTPVALSASAASGRLTVAWEPPASGAAVSSYVLEVSGAITLSVPFATRGVTAPVPPGVYTFQVRAVNACGGSALSAPVTVTVS